MKERIVWIDIIKAICIMFVMYSHSPFPKTWIRQDYFFLVGFVFCSGYTFSIDKGLKHRVIRILDSLVIPYLIFSVIMFFPFYNNLVALSNDPTNTIIEKGKYILCGYAEWFIPCLIFLELIYAIALKLKISSLLTMGGVILYLLGVVTDSSLPWHVDTAAFFILFFHLGYNTKNIELNLNSVKPDIVIIMMAAFLYCSSVLFKLFPFNTSLNSYSNESLTMMMSIVGILVLLLVSNKLKMNWYFNYLGKNSLLLFYLHLPFVYYGYQLLNRFVNMRATFFDNSLFAIVYILLISLILYPIVKFINRYKVLSGKGHVVENLICKQ